MKFNSALINSPLGEIMAMSFNDKLMSVRFLDGFNYNQVEETSECLELLRTELDSYFAGKLKKFKSTFTPLAAKFSNQVWEELRQIPYGETRSYSDIAKALGKPKSVRSVGTANAKNRCLIIVPCHRVIAKDGSLSGFAAGIERKEWLLKHEQKFS
ncbi:MAG: methylated-DNA--[protein]-cysteine S-methyltransferase [Rickettsiales bacterium]